MKKIAIIANKRSFAEHIKNDIEAYFHKYASFRVYTTAEAAAKERFEEDAVVLSSWVTFDRVKEKLTSRNILEVVSFTLSLDNIKKMNEIKGVKRAFLVNYDYRVCMQVITQLYELGYDGIDFVPYYGDESALDPSITVAITPNEAQLAPPGVTLYDIGERPIEPSCILRLANKLGINGIFDSEEAEAARKKVALPQWGLDNLLTENYNSRNNIKAIIEYIEDGILICNNEGESYLGNEKAKELLKIDVIDGLNLKEYVPAADLSDDTLRKKTTIVTVDGKKLVFTVTAIISREGKNGNLVVIKNFEEAEERQHRLRNKVSGEKHEARYTFADMKGESQAIRDVIGLARRMAKSSSSIMILGESGTGKEILAQSIHNESSRRNYNFVALNCAAIPENLLESELFGYEEGAFTGARKGGKIGYFELAHKGTIFLDEIGEMPIALQGKLLRVIEEKKVAKIGSSRLIDVDVRIIAATNKNMKELVAEGRFREDLYYRLNVLPIKLPNLNQRGRDTLILFDNFRENLGSVWRCSQKTETLLLEHKWQGNIREVRNVVEYLDNLGKAVIEPEDLPEDFLEGKAVPQRIENTQMKKKTNVCAETGDENQPADTGCGTIDWNEFQQFLMKEGATIQLHRYVLEALLYFRQQQQNAGRMQVKAWLDEELGLNYTETEVRNSLHKLAAHGYIRTLKGRGGSAILPAGRKLLERIKGFIGE